MGAGRFDALMRMLAELQTRRGTLGVFGTALAFFLSPFGPETTSAKKKRRGCRRVDKKCGGKHNRKCCDHAKCRGGRCKCTGQRKACRGTCIPRANCCGDADCGDCERCANGICVAGPCQCEAPFTACGADCVNLSDDDSHCGSCDNACVGAATCQNGACAAGGTYTLVNQWDITGPSSQPFGIAVDGQGNVYVTDLGANNVLKFTASGDPIDDWSSVGNGPIGVAVNRSTGGIYVANSNSDAIQPFASDATPGDPWALLDAPTGVAVNQSNGEVYVTIAGGNAVGVQRFTSDGDVIANWLAPDYPFELPLGIGIAPNGDVYVSDDGACTVFRFTAAGDALPVTSCDGPIEFDDPWGVAVDGASDVYICDSGNQRVLKTAAGFTLIGQIGDETNFQFPVGVAVSLSGYVYVADSGNSNVQRFAPA